jgi:ribosomal protein L16 Arg81 hydroxylase
MTLLSLKDDLVKTNFHRRPFQLGHNLSGHELFALPRLIELAKSMPRDHIEYSSGKVSVDQDPETIPRIDMPAEEVIRHIEECDAWMVIKGVETDPEYRALLHAFLNEVSNAAGPDIEPFHDLKGFIFVSSAGSTTPFHVDAEENILVQIKGDKFVHIFDNADRSLVSEEDMEISPSKHRNQHYDPSFEARAETYSLKAGDAVHIPYLWPHWVRTGNEYTISMAMTWKTPAVLRSNKIRLMNGTLRRFNLPQAAPGVSPSMDGIKVFAHDAARAIIDPLRKSETLRRLLRSAIYGREANYYYGNKDKAGKT